MPITNYAILQDKLGYTFTNKDLVKAAVTHASTAGTISYERLEFLGDRVLGLMVSESLYIRFPKEPEGDLAKRLAALVQGTFLAKIAHDMELAQFIQFSEAEKNAGGAENDNILADVVESLIGALYLDGGIAPCRVFIDRYWDKYFDKMTAPPQHPKTQLQEWAQGQGLPLPTYKIIKQHGPDHAPSFDVALNVEGKPPTLATGRSRQEAEKRAAKTFLSGLNT